ncbi:MAG: protoporphyrinogen oxidase, partial [Angustibacter sp.]
TQVTRWPQALPQYAVGHHLRVARLHREAELLGGLALAGAFDQGVGLPSCIASGRAAARRTLTHLTVDPAGPHE